MNHYLITAIVDFLIGVFAFRKRENPASTALALTAISLSVWSMELYFLSTLENIATLEVWFHITRWGMFFIPPCFAYFSWRLMRSKSDIFLKLVVIPGFVSALLLGIVNTFFYPSRLIRKDSGYLPEVDAVYYAFILVFLWCFVGSIVLASLRYRSASSYEKQKIKWLLITLTFCFFGGVFIIFFMPSGMYLSKYTGSILNISFIALLFYSAVEHRLMDIRFLLSNGIAKAIVLAFFSWCFLIAYSLLKPFERAEESAFVFLVVMILMLELYPRIIEWLLPNARKFIIRTTYDLEKAKAQMQVEMGRSVGIGSFFKALDNLLTQVVRIDSFHLLVIGEDRESNQRSKVSGETKLQKLSYISSDDLTVEIFRRQTGMLLEHELADFSHGSDVLKEAYLGFGLNFNGKLIAVLALGRPETSYFRYDDICLFEWLQVELGQAIHRIMQLEEMQNQLGQAKKTLSMLGVMNHYHHDIKAPLAIIDGVLSNDIYDKEKQRDIVLQQVERGSQLIATMAEILKGERRRRVRELSLEQVIRDSLFLFNQGIDDIFYEFGNVPLVKGDAEDLKILIINLAKNAMEARRADEPLFLTVRTWLQDRQVALSVKDTGIGIEKKRLDLIWDDDSDSLKLTGNGIGLQAIKRISDEHGARVEVKSEVGIGTEFTFILPESIVCNDSTDRNVENINLDIVQVKAAGKPFSG